MHYARLWIQDDSRMSFHPLSTGVLRTPSFWEFWSPKMGERNRFNRPNIGAALTYQRGQLDRTVVIGKVTVMPVQQRHFPEAILIILNMQHISHPIGMSKLQEYIGIPRNTPDQCTLA